MMLLPIVLRLLARFEGVPTQVGIELSLMDRFFLFQVVVSLVELSCSLRGTDVFFFVAVARLPHRDVEFGDYRGPAWDCEESELGTDVVGAEAAQCEYFLLDVYQ